MIMCDDWIEEDDRAPINLGELSQQPNNNPYGYNDNQPKLFSNNQYEDRNNQYGDRGARGGRGYHRGRGGRGGRRGWRRNDGAMDNRNEQNNGKSNLTFQIAQRDVGRLIGTKGCNISKLKTETQCSIDIGEENSNIKNSVDIHIKGDDDAMVAKGRKAIEKHLGYSSLGNPDSDKEDEPIDWDNLKKENEIAEKKRWAKSVPLLKNFYVEHPDVKNLSPTQIKEFREYNNHIKVYNFNSDVKDPLLNPVGSFYQAFEPYPEIIRTIDCQGFDRPSPIQAQAWPYLLSGKVTRSFYTTIEINTTCDRIIFDIFLEIIHQCS